MSELPVLTFISGFGHHADALRPLADLLADLGSVKLRSVDELGSMSLARASNSPLSDEVSPYALALSQQLSPDREHVLIGWSMGAMIALETAVLAPELVVRVVLLSGTARFVADLQNAYSAGVPRAELRALRRLIASDHKKGMRQFYAGVYGGENSGELIDRLVESSMPSSVESADQALRYLEKTDLRAKLSAVCQPVQLVHGCKDAIIPSEASKYLGRHLSSACEFELVNGSHGLCVQHPGKIANEIRCFLAQ